jgi:putative ABC transport system permease protein
MNVLSTIWRGIRSMGQAREVKREIDEELRFHLAQRTAENVAAGMLPEEAARAARKRFGNVQGIREEMRGLRGVGWLDSLAQDIRFGLRILIKQPIALASAILALALGIGLVAMMFCTINGMMLSKLPLPEGERLAATSVPAWAFEGISKHQRSFESMVSFGSFHGRFKALGPTTSRSLCFTTANLFDVLRAPGPVAGRGLRLGEDKAGAEPVALISFELWQEEFQGSPAALGSTIWIEGKARTVVGVMPRDFHFPINNSVWVAAPVAQEIANIEQGFVFGRLKPGVSYSKSEAELNTLWAALNPPPKPGEPELEKIRVGPYIKGVTDSLTKPDYAGIGVMAAMLATLLVLFLACANVALLTLSRSVKRIREFAVRGALGATRRRLVLQMLVENLVLAAAGAIGGTFAAGWIKNLMLAQMPADTSVFRGYASWWRFDMDWRVFLFIAGLTLLVNLAAGLWPALEATKGAVNEMLKDQGGPSGFKLGGLQRFLIASQVAASVIILVGAIALVQHGRRLSHVRLPFDPRGVVTADVQVPDLAVTNQFFEEAITRIANIPGVKAVALANEGFAFGHGVTRIEIEGQTYPRRVDQPQIAKRVVSFNYFETMNLALQQGRGFVEDDRATSPPVAVINTTFARRYLPSGNPLGKRFRDAMDSRWLTVVGCVSDALIYGNDGREAVFYVPLSQHPCGRMTALVQGNSEPSWRRGLLTEIERMEPDQPLPQISCVQRELDGVDSGGTFEMLLLEVCGAASLFLSALGVFGLISFSVSQRTREIGIRMALGATQGRVIWTILRQFVIQIGIGLGIGAAMALGLVRVFSSVLPATATEPSVYLEVTLLLGVASLAAVLGPARRASKIDPMAALRYE